MIQPKACSLGQVRSHTKSKENFQIAEDLPHLGGSPSPTTCSCMSCPRRCCPPRRPRLDPRFPSGRFGSGPCSMGSCKQATQRWSHCFSALIHTDSKRQGKGKKKCTKNSFDRVKNESKVKHSSICQNKITASPLKKKKQPTQLKLHFLVGNNGYICFPEDKRVD